MPGPDVTVLKKNSKSAGIAVDTAANIANCTAVDNRQGDVAGIIVTALSTAITLNVFVSTTLTGTYVGLYTAANALEAITVSAADRAYILPTALRAFPFFKICCNAGTLTVTVVRKS
jgi:hypothetical protein